MPRVLSHLGAVLAATLAGCGVEGEPSPGPPARPLASPSARSASAPSVPNVQVPTSALPSDVIAFCSSCHALTSPTTLPKQKWPDVVALMYASAVERGVKPPRDEAAVTSLFVARAPEAIAYPPLLANDGPLRFERSERFSAFGSHAAGATHFTRIVDAAGTRWLVNDTTGGGVFSAITRGRSPLREIAAVPHPARFVATDLDGDTRLDLVVSDLGSLLNIYESKGQLLWLRPRRQGRGYERRVLLDHVGRVADTAVADVDDDGDLDIAVAVFGLAGGQLGLLEQTKGGGGAVTFMHRALESRPGAVDVELADLNGDGRVELIGTVSQEIESVVAYELKAGGAVQQHPAQQHVLANADGPGWGSSGITLGDLDADGDLDLVWSHGDTFDMLIVRPEHGLLWLENTGGFRFERREAWFLPGAQASRIADLDGDGDADIVAAAALPWPGITERSVLGPTDGPSLIWLEQTARGVFEPHVIERGRARHTWVDVSDVNGDGNLDVLVSELNPSALANERVQHAHSDDAWVTAWISAPSATRGQ